MVYGEWLQTIRFEPLNYFLKAVTFLGNKEFLLFFPPILFWCWRKRAAVHLILLLIISLYINCLLKAFFAWDRPPEQLWLIKTGGHAFPSGHAVAAAVMFGYLAYEVKRSWFTVVSIVLMILVAISRVYLGVHYVQDIVAGLVLGIICLHIYRWVIGWFSAGIAKLPSFVKGVGFVVLGLVMFILFRHNLTAMAGGMFAGVGVGFLIEPRFASFEVHGRWYNRIMRTLVGFVMLLALIQAADWFFPTSLAFVWLQFFAFGIFFSVVMPWLFIQLRLARRES